VSQPLCNGEERRGEPEKNLRDAMIRQKKRRTQGVYGRQKKKKKRPIARKKRLSKKKKRRKNRRLPGVRGKAARGLVEKVVAKRGKGKVDKKEASEIEERVPGIR